MLPLPPVYGTLELFSDLPPVATNPWLELYQLAERAGVSVEYLCTTVEIASLHTNEGKSTSASFATPLYGDDLEEVARILADDEFEFKAKEWRESEHPRDSLGRFSDGSGSFRFTDGDKSYDLLDLRQGPTHAERVRTQRELTDIHNAVNDLYPGHTSSWARVAKIQHFLTLKANGQKNKECPITIAFELVRHPLAHWRYSTMIHESLHALFKSTPEEYRAAPGWDEAVIEACTRRHRPIIAQKLGWNITEEEFAKRDKINAYSQLVKELENMRKKLHYDEDSFYNALLAIPPTKRKDFIRNASASLTGNDAVDFRAAFVRGCRVLDEYRYQAPFDHTKAQTSPMNREDVIRYMFTARTPEEVIEARRVRDEWLEEHPGDWGIYSGSEMLENIAVGLGMEYPTDPSLIFDCSSVDDTESLPN